MTNVLIANLPELAVGGIYTWFVSWISIRIYRKVKGL